MVQRYALVTGGSRGLGRAICLKLASQGFYVIINYKSNIEAANQTLDTIINNKGKAELLQFDVSNKKEIEQAIDSWQEKHKEEYISVLVNNAGIRQDNLMIFMQDAQWSDVINTTLNGFFYTTRYLLKDMISHR